MKNLLAISCLLLILLPFAHAQVVPLPNPSFEEGVDTPDGWIPEGTGPSWPESGGSTGARAISVVGSGGTTGMWRSTPLSLEPGAVYRLTFMARGEGYENGNVPTGPEFCNRDLDGLTEAWRPIESYFRVPEEAPASMTCLRFGLWEGKGGVVFDNVAIMRAMPVQKSGDGIVLGVGEVVQDGKYRFIAPLGAACGNYARVLQRATAGFNSNRWLISPGAEVVYRCDVDEHQLTPESLELNVIHFVSGSATVSFSSDGAKWSDVGGVDKKGAFAFSLTNAPSQTIWLRLQGNPDCNLQVDRFAFTAACDGSPMDFRGETRFVAVEKTDSRLDVDFASFDGVINANIKELHAKINNKSDAPISIKPSTNVEDDLGKRENVGSMQIPANGAASVAFGFETPTPGNANLTLTLGPDSPYRAISALKVPVLAASCYGESLPASTDTTSVWWASSGWKVDKDRPAPIAKGNALRIEMAANETEAAQLVVRPLRDFKGMTAQAGDLTGPGGAVLPASSIELLRVAYVEIDQPTDETGVAGAWPDPLPPFSAPVDVAANTNQPIWVRVHAPAGQAPGEYRGSILLKAEGYEASAPIIAKIYNFNLPDRMTCASAFGFDPGLVFQYHGLKTDADKRVVLEKYWDSFASHRISPYDPAPLDPIRVEWPGASAWVGGVRDTSVFHDGASSLLVKDEMTDASVSVSAGEHPAIPLQGVRLRFWYKTATPGHQTIVTFGHKDATGQWMPGRNRDMVITGDGEWQSFDQTITSFPEGAASLYLSLHATLWREDGANTGAVWYDSVSLTNAATGEELVTGGDFEPVKPDLTPRFDWTAWDAAMTRAIDEHGFTSFSIPIQGLGGGTFVSRVEPNLLGYPENTPEYATAFDAYAKGVQEHLRAKGWLDKAFVYWFDEPEPRDYDFVMNGFRKLKEACPDVRRMLTEQVEPELVGGPNLWCPITPAYNHVRAEERRREGDQFWWYVCTAPKAPYCTLFIDHAGTELRAWLWQTWQRGIEGILVWQTNYWTSPAAYPTTLQNPYDDPMSWVVGYGVATGSRQPWGNGDGRFLYPPITAASGAPDAPVLEGPVESIRWEMLRDGVEDYEYFAMLKRLLAEKGSGLKPEDRARFEALLTVPEAVSQDITTFTLDPRPMEKHRASLAEAIEILTKG